MENVLRQWGKQMNKNYRVQIGTVKVAAFWNEPKQGQKNGYYSICITRSSRDRDGNWKDEKMYIAPNEMMVLIGALNEIAHVVNMPIAFTTQSQSHTPSDDNMRQANNETFDRAQNFMNTGVNDDIPF